MSDLRTKAPWLFNPKIYPVAVYLILVLTLAVMFPGIVSWLLIHPMPLGVLVFIGFVGFAFWVGFRKKQSAESAFKPYAPSVFLFIILFLLIWVIRLFANAQGSDFLGAKSSQEVKRYGYIPQEPPYIPTVYRNARNQYSVDIPLNKIWSEVRLPIKSGQTIRILSIEPIRASLPSWYLRAQSGKSNRNAVIGVGERGARQKRNQYEDWMWIPYRQIWPQTEHFIDSSLCPDGTVFGCPLIKVGPEWRFRVPGNEGYDTELCEQTVDHFYFGINLPFGQHIAASGVYRITFTVT